MNRRLMPAALVLAPLLAAGTPGPDDFPFSRALQGVAAGRTEVVSVVLDAPVLAASADGFRDLRVLDDRGLEVPCAVEKVTTNATCVVRRTVASRAVALRELPGNRIEAEFELTDKDARADGFDIRTPLRDFVRAVTVEGSADGANWRPLVASAEILDYTRYLDVRRTQVALPAGDCTRFRITIGNASEERAQPLLRLVRQRGGSDAGAETLTQEMLRTPFRIDSVAFWRNETVVERSREIASRWDLPAPARAEREREKSTEFTLEVGRRPVNRLTIATDTKNFSRRGIVLVPAVENGVTDWREVAAGRLVNVDLPGYAEQSLSMDIPEQRAAQIRVTVNNGDNPPLAAVRFAAEGPVHRLLMLAETGRTYRLFYGAPQMEAPAYELAAVLAPVRQGLKPAEWSMGPPEASAAYRSRGGATWLNSPALLTGAIILAALVLLGILARSMKSVGRKLDGDSAPPP